MRKKLQDYLANNNYPNFDIKAVLFDMDGVLYDSMKWHAKSWYQTFSELNIPCTAEEFYLHEGRTGHNTINIVIKRTFGRDATQKEKETIYKRKSDLFVKYNDGATIAYAKEVVEAVKKRGLKCIVVTGSGQYSLLDNLAINFPDTFDESKMVTAHNVTKGKPHPEPYLMGLERAGHLAPNQAIVVENAPMGAESGSSAKIFTIAVNTGPLDAKILLDAGANTLYPSMEDFYKDINNLLDEMGVTKL